MAQHLGDGDSTSGSPMISASHLRPLRALAHDAGISLDDILRELDLETESAAQSSIALADYFRVLEQLSIAAGDETCRLSTRPLLPGSSNFVLSNLAGCGDLFAAMKRIAQSYNMLHGGAYNTVERSNGHIVYRIDDRDFPYAEGIAAGDIHFAMDSVLILLHGMLTYIADGKLGPLLRKVHTKQSKATGDDRHLAFWAPPIRWGCATYALFYDEKAAALPISITDDALAASGSFYRTVVELIGERERWDLSRMGIAGRVTELLRRGHPNQDDVARALGLSVATLRRRLAAEGACFRELRRALLDEEAKRLLAQHHAIGDVAETLGFSDFRSFTRAFKAWNGMTPKSFADRLR